MPGGAPALKRSQKVLVAAIFRALKPGISAKLNASQQDRSTQFQFAAVPATTSLTRQGGAVCLLIPDDLLPISVTSCQGLSGPS